MQHQEAVRAQELNLAGARVIAGAEVATQEMMRARQAEIESQAQANQLVVSEAMIQRSQAAHAQRVATDSQALALRASQVQQQQQHTGQMQESEQHLHLAEHRIVAAMSTTQNAESEALRRTKEAEDQALRARHDQWARTQHTELALAQSQARTRQAEEALERERMCNREAVAVAQTPQLTPEQIQHMISSSIQTSLGPIISHAVQQAVIGIKEQMAPPAFVQRETVPEPIPPSTISSPDATPRNAVFSENGQNNGHGNHAPSIYSAGSQAPARRHSPQTFDISSSRKSQVDKSDGGGGDDDGSEGSGRGKRGKGPGGGSSADSPT